MATQPREGSYRIPAAAVLAHLRGIRFPAARSDLLKCARGNNAPLGFIRALEVLPDREYMDLADVMDAASETGSSR